jgi:DNA polymerase (family X)
LSKNSLVASVLFELADYSEMEDDLPYRARAYRRAAQSVNAMEQDVEELWKQGTLRELPGVGENIEKKIDEILRTGKLETLEKLKRATPVDVASLTKVEGVGPKTVKLLYKELKIKNLEELEKAVRGGRLADFRGLGVKAPELLLQRIENAKIQSNRVMLIEAETIAKRVVDELKKNPAVKKFEIAGSFRRKKETVGDMDVLVVSETPQKIVESFTKSDEVKEVIVAGEFKASVKFERNFQVDLRVVPAKSWGAALLYFTGSKAHNIELRTRALSKKYHLSEYALFKEDNETFVAGRTEEEVYSALELDYIPPELRENRGEISAAAAHKLPKLIERRDVKGDLQMHTSWSDGVQSVREMAEGAIKLGYKYIAITDHIGGLKIANAMDEERIKQQRKEIDGINSEFEKGGSDFHVLQGAEVNIKADGTLDMPNSILKEFEIVLASIHSGFKDDVQKIMMRFSGALENENVDVIAHPTGRKIMERTGYPVNIRALIDGALKTETVLEIDGYPNRLDLSDENAFEAIKAGCKISVDTDSHNVEELSFMEQGIFQARRAWAEKEDVLNTMSYRDLLHYLEN